MQEKILELVQAMGPVEEGEKVLLKGLCAAAEAELTGKLREGLRPEDCGEAFPVAAAWMALAGLCAGREAGGEPASWSAGAVSVKESRPAEERARTLREEARRVMAPYLRDEGFYFRGVWD